MREWSPERGKWEPVYLEPEQPDDDDGEAEARDIDHGHVTPWSRSMRLLRWAELDAHGYDDPVPAVMLPAPVPVRHEFDEHPCDARWDREHPDYGRGCR